MRYDSRYNKTEEELNDIYYEYYNNSELKDFLEDVLSILSEHFVGWIMKGE